MFNKRTKIVIAGAFVLAASFSLLSANAQMGKFSKFVDGKGSISLPENFRDDMVHIGSWFVPEGGASGFHDVYTERSSAESYRKNGKFPDGATLVKELRASMAGDYTTGEGVSHATGELKQWFVMIKDAEGRFPDNKNWGKGWGWGLYKPDNRAVNVSTDFEADCLGCHVPAESNDYIYIEAYPTLTEK